jgi:phosphoribosyl 1,2-cyclic phosphodiesterase
MSAHGLHLTFRGVRGTVPTPGKSGGVFGGNTTCLDLSLAPEHHLVIDCGSGMRSLTGLSARAGNHGNLRFEVLLTHYHLDHLIGLPVFKPLYDPGTRFTFYGVGWGGEGIQATLEKLLGPPWFPVSFRDTPSVKRYVDLDGTPFSIGPLRITHTRLNHPQGVTAYRLERAGRAVVFATDHEGGDDESDAGLRALAREADVLIHDAQYTPEEYEQGHQGWGHSSWRHAAETARAAGARHLVLFHHDPDRSDEAVEALIRDAAGLFPSVEGAREGMSVEI